MRKEFDNVIELYVKRTALQQVSGIQLLGIGRANVLSESYRRISSNFIVMFYTFWSSACKIRCNALFALVNSFYIVEQKPLEKIEKAIFGRQIP